MDIYLIDYAASADRLSGSAEADRITRDTLHELGYSVNMVPWCLDSYQAYRGSRPDTPLLRGDWARIAVKHPDASRLKMAILGLSVAWGINLTATVKQVASNLDMQPRAIFAAMATDRPRNHLLIAAVHAQY